MTGFDSSLMGGLNVMDSYQSYFTLNTSTYALNTAISYVGGCIGSLFAGQLTDLRGRREALFIAGTICTVGAVIQAAAVHIAMFITGRFIIGVGMAIAAVACPTYVAECAKPSTRAFAMGLYYSCWGVGTLLANAVCVGVSLTFALPDYSLPCAVRRLGLIMGLATT
jgi:MFS family permease